MPIVLGEQTDSRLVSPSGTTVTFGHTVHAGTGRAIVVAAFSRQTTVTAASFNGSDMGAARVTHNGTGGITMNVSLFAAIIADGDHSAIPANVVITSSGTPDLYAAGIAWSWFGVDAIAPISDVDDTQQISAGTINFPALSAVEDGDCMIDAIATNSTTACTPINETRVQAVNFLALDQGRQVGSSYFLVNSGTPTLVTMGWDTDVSSSATYVGLALKGGAGAPDATSKFWIFGPR